VHQQFLPQDRDDLIGERDALWNSCHQERQSQTKEPVIHCRLLRQQSSLVLTKYHRAMVEFIFPGAKIKLWFPLVQNFPGRNGSSSSWRSCQASQPFGSSRTADRTEQRKAVRQ